MNNINVVVDVPDSFLDDILTTAFEGGSNYWLKQVSLQPKPDTPITSRKFELNHPEIISMDCALMCYNEDELEGKLLTKDKLLNAIEWYIGINGLDVLDDHDAQDADTILQYALFGEVVYG